MEPEGSLLHSQVTIISLKKKPTATKCRDHCLISLIAHTAKVVAGSLAGLQGKLRMYLEKIRLDLKGEKETGVKMGC
jgi:hypothetical protein